MSEKYLDDALALIEEHGTNDPYEILENLGVVVIPINIDAAFLGMFRILDGVSYVIYNTHADENVITQVLAHELGHYLYHKDYASEAELADFGLSEESSIIEAQANTFAAHLLIDEDEVLDTIEEGMSYMELAQRLMVDENLLLYKLKSMKKRGLKINLGEVPRSQFFQNLAEQAKKYETD